MLTPFLLFMLSFIVGELASKASNSTGVWLGMSFVSWATPFAGIIWSAGWLSEDFRMMGLPYLL